MRAGRTLIAVAIALGATAIVAALGTVSDSPLARLQNIAFDRYQRLLPRPAGAPAVALVDIDNASLAALGQWPWPRTLLADLVEKTAAAGARVIGLDLTLSEPDRTSPSELRRMLASAGVPPAESARVLAGLPEHDAVLARALRGAGVVVGVALDEAAGTAAPASKAGFATVGGDPFRFTPRYARAIVDLPALTDAAAGSGFLNVIPDPDGIVRRVALVMRVGDQPYPSLVAEMLRVAQGAKSYTARAEATAGSLAAPLLGGLEALRIGNLTVPTRRDGTLWLHYGAPGAIARVSAADVVAGRFNRDLLAGRMVVIGTTALGLKDFKPTPASRASAGVEVHLEALQQIADGAFLERPDWLVGAQIVGVAALAVLVALMGVHLGIAWSAPASLVAFLAVFAVSWWAFAAGSLLVDPVAPAETLTLTFSGVSLLRRFQAERASRRLRRSFSRYLSPHLVEELVAHPEKLSLGGEMREAAVMFCDIRNFSTIAEGLDPQALTGLLNGFLAPMSAIVLDHRGTIDKYIGDCIMAFWNAPLDDPDYNRHAVAAALAMRRGLDAVNQGLRASWNSSQPFKPLRIAIGLNSGACCVGNMGSQHRFDYSILGDAVNLAARLAELAAERELDLLVGEATVAALPGAGFRLVDTVHIKGRVQPARIYTLDPADGASFAGPEAASG